jgi:MFS transporter, FHS family, glucose/mannose:H+ symporter
MPLRRTASRFESLPAGPFYAGLVLTGFATSLLGPILPALSARWSLSDTQGGWLFAAQFLASTCGSILSSYSPRRSVALGFAAIAAGAALLTVGHYGVALLAFGLIGIGLGAAVSAINLIFGTEYPERRGPLLTWVNLCWGAGAVLAPQLAALAEHESSLPSFLLLLTLCAFALFAVFTPLLRTSAGVARQSGAAARPSRGRLPVPIFAVFSAMLFLYVGAETSVAGWIATYAHRLGGLSVARASLYVSAFWIAIVVGRVLVVALLRVFAERTVLLGGLAVAMAGVGTLLFPHAPRTALLAVIVAGLGCAPLFPLLVSRMLARTGRTRSVGWIFAICGSGGAVVPWITGAVSQHGGGLRAAFLAPLGALAGILICVLIEAGMAMPERNFAQR